METKPIGLYVHIPFCLRKCNYCDFCSVSYEKSRAEKYTESLIFEIRSYKKEPRIKVDTVFFGGGTPSVLSPELFSKIANTIRESFDIAENSEFSIEVNPATLSHEKLKAFIDAGVNRISIGLQSIHENEMKILGRIHTYEDFEKTYSMIRAAGIDNLNVDLMYGIPEQTKQSLRQTVEKIISLSPSHISAYGLIIEDGTPFYENRRTLILPDEDTEYDMYLMIEKMLTDAGYCHYEISNYAKDGYESKHNLKYWRDEEYIGVGLAAHSYLDGKRYFNTDSFDEYFDGFGVKYRQEENKSRGLDKFEYAMLALRLSEGISLPEYEALFGEKFAAGKEELLKKYISMGFMKISDDRLSFTGKGFYVSNTILAELL